MTKADMVKIICEKMGFALKESTEIVEQVFDIMKETLEGGEKITISGFGPSESGTDLKVSKQKHGNVKNVFKAYLLRVILLHQTYFF